jgi:hypothetical protein
MSLAANDFHQSEANIANPTGAWELEGLWGVLLNGWCASIEYLDEQARNTAEDDEGHTKKVVRESPEVEVESSTSTYVPFRRSWC